MRKERAWCQAKSRRCLRSQGWSQRWSRVVQGSRRGGSGDPSASDSAGLEFLHVKILAAAKLHGFEAAGFKSSNSRYS